MIAWGAFLAICAAMLLTVADIFARTLSQTVAWWTGTNPGWGIYGLVDLTQLAMMVAMPLAIAAAFFMGAHICVDLLLVSVPHWTRVQLTRFGALLGGGLMSLSLWTSWDAMVAQLSFTTTSSTLGLEYTWYWVPLIAGLAFSVCGCVAALFVPDEGVGPDDV